MSTTTANAPIKTISAALKLVDTKKENLKKAFEHLQSHSSLLSSFNLNWSDLDAHFGSAHDSLNRRFHRLEELEADQPQPSAVNDPSSSVPSQQPAGQDLVESIQNDPSSLQGLDLEDPAGVFIPARPQLKYFCEKMDGKGLRRYIGELSNERSQIKIELSDAIRSSPDPGSLVLDAVEGFYVQVKGGWDSEVGARRGICELLLETLMGLKQSYSVEVEERAKKLALEWKGKVSADEDHMSVTMGFLLLVGAYKLVSDFNVAELVDYLFRVSARHRQTIDLIRAFGLLNEVSDLIQRLISKGKHLLAVKFVFGFNLTEKFPPVPLLKNYVEETMEAVKKLRTEGNNCLRSMNQAMSKEIGSLRSVIKIIEEYKLETEDLKCNLEKQLKQIEKEREKASRKRSTISAPASKPRQQNGSKHPRTNASIGPAAVPMNVGRSNSTISSLYQPHLLPEHPAPYLSSAAGPYGFVGSTPSAAYAGSSAGPYGLVGSTPSAASYVPSSAGLYGAGGGPIGLHGNPSPAGSHIYSSDPGLGSQLYSTDPHVISSYSERPTSYAAYGMPPQYQPPYYTQ